MRQGLGGCCSRMLRQGFRRASTRLPSWAPLPAVKGTVAHAQQPWLRSGYTRNTMSHVAGRRNMGTAATEPNTAAEKRVQVAVGDIEGAQCEDDTHEIMFYR